MMHVTINIECLILGSLVTIPYQLNLAEMLNMILQYTDYGRTM